MKVEGAFFAFKGKSDVFSSYISSKKESEENILKENDFQKVGKYKDDIANETNQAIRVVFAHAKTFAL